jgi:hypothetical protein
VTDSKRDGKRYGNCHWQSDGNAMANRWPPPHPTPRKRLASGLWLLAVVNSKDHHHLCNARGNDNDHLRNEQQ